MASTLDQIISQLQPVYQPQIDSIKSQEAALPGQYDAQAQGLGAAQQQAFGSILDGARARGTGVAFGGIPLGEQAQYTASTYLPALANLKTSQDQQQQSLEDALNKIYSDQYTQGVGIDQFNQNLAEQSREANQSAAASIKAAQAANPTITPTTGIPQEQGTVQNPSQASTLTGGKSQQDGANAVVALLNSGNVPLISQTINAIKSSAQQGNTYDQFKLSLLDNYRNTNTGQNQYGNIISLAENLPNKQQMPTF